MIDPCVNTVLSHFHILSKAQHYDLDCIRKRTGGKELSGRARKNYQAIYRSLSMEERLKAGE